MSGSLTKFIESVSQVGLLTADEIAEFIDSLESGEPEDAQALAEALQASGHLTPFQAEILARGEFHRLVFADYLLLEQIGSGGMGQVFKALHRRMKRVVALKALPPTATASESSVKRFYKEVEAAARLTHPNIVHAYDAGESGGVHYLVMEYVDGQDVSALVHHKQTLPVELAVEIAVQAAHGLEYAHKRGVFHRDIKLANLLLDREGTIKVLDMGLARLADPSDSQSEDAQTDGITHTNQMMGTADYISPEQARNSKIADHRADIYSLGCCLYRMIAGKPPYDADSVFMKVLAHVNEPIPELSQVNDSVSDELQAVFAKMLAKKPDDRYQSMAEVVTALGACVEIDLATAESPRLASLVPEQIDHSVDRESDQPTLSTSSNDLGTSSPAESPLAPPAEEEMSEGIALDPATDVDSPEAAIALDPASMPPEVSPTDAETPRTAETVPAAHAEPANTKSDAPAKDSSDPTDWKQKATAAGSAAADKTRAAAAEVHRWATSPENKQRAEAVRVKVADGGRAAAGWYRTQRKRIVERFPKLKPTHVDWIAASAAGLLVIVTVISLGSLGGSDADDLGFPRPEPIALDPSDNPAGPVDSTETDLSTRLAQAPEVQLDRPEVEATVSAGRGSGSVTTDSNRPEQEPQVPNVRLGARTTLEAPKIVSDPLDNSEDLISLIQPDRALVGSFRRDKGHLLIAPDASSLRNANKPAVTVVPYLPATEYDITMVGIRSSGSGGMLISLPVEVTVGDTNVPPEFRQLQRLPTLVIGPLVSRPRGGRLFPRLIQPVQPVNQANAIEIRNGQPLTVVIKVRKQSLDVTVDDKPVDIARMFDPFLDQQFRHNDDKTPRVGVYSSSWRLTKFSITDVTGEGKPLE